jgi:phage shock protein C
MKLCRSNADCRLAGVCGGLAEYLGWSSTRVRIIWVLATIFTAFAGVVVYLALWFLMPKAPIAPPTFESPPLQPWKKTV